MNEDDFKRDSFKLLLLVELLLLFKESKAFIEDEDSISFCICESTDCAKRSGEFSVHLLMTGPTPAMLEPPASMCMGGVVGVVAKLLPVDSCDVDCCIRLRYSFMDSLRLGCGGGSGAVSCGFSRGS